MNCDPNQPVRVQTKPVIVSRPKLGDGATMIKYQGTTSCGWSSTSVGTEVQAAGWARRHIGNAHEPGGPVPCAEGETHVINKRTGFCLYCNHDAWPSDRRSRWTMAQAKW